MKKIIKLTESDLIKIIKKVINESSPVEKTKSPCPGMKICWASANTPAGCCPLGYTCAYGGCIRIGDLSDFSTGNSTAIVKEAPLQNNNNGKKKCVCKPEETIHSEFPCICKIPMTPPTP